MGVIIHKNKKEWSSNSQLTLLRHRQALQVVKTLTHRMSQLTMRPSSRILHSRCSSSRPPRTVRLRSTRTKWRMTLSFYATVSACFRWSMRRPPKRSTTPPSKRKSWSIWEWLTTWNSKKEYLNKTRRRSSRSRVRIGTTRTPRAASRTSRTPSWTCTSKRDKACSQFVTNSTKTLTGRECSRSRTASTRKPSAKVSGRWPPKEGRRSSSSARTRSALARTFRRSVLSRKRDSSISTRRKLRI